MRFVSIRELQDADSDAWGSLEVDDLVLTAGGKPKAIVMRLDDDL